MSKLFKAIVAADLAVAMAIGASAPANAVSVENYNNYDRITQAESVEFFTQVPDLLAEAHVVNMALGTQALRAKTAGNEEYSQCILTKLVLPKDATTPPDSFSQLFSQMLAHKTATIPLEQILAGAVLKNCGVEPPPAAKPAQ